MRKTDKPPGWLHYAARIPPFSVHARIEAGVPLRRLQRAVAAEGIAAPLYC